MPQARAWHSPADLQGEVYGRGAWGWAPRFLGARARSAPLEEGQGLHLLAVGEERKGLEPDQAKGPRRQQGARLEEQGAEPATHVGEARRGRRPVGKPMTGPRHNRLNRSLNKIRNRAR